MYWIAKLFSTPPPASMDGCHFEIERAPRHSACRTWLTKIVTFPFTLPERIYNTYLLFKHGELREPAAKNMCPFKVLSPFRTLFFSFNLTRNLDLMKAILHHPRKNPDTGLFNDQDNKLVFLFLVRELFPHDLIEERDSLLTCLKEDLFFHRQPILQFLTPSKIKATSKELVGIAHDVVSLCCNSKKEINAAELSFTFTTTVISRLLLGHPGPIKKYQEISLALDCLNRIAIKKAWHIKLSSQEAIEYQVALATIRQAIEQVLDNQEKPPLGSLVEMLQKSMTPTQVKVALFNLFFAGSETAASLLTYMFWQLGRNSHYQEIIQKELSQDDDLFQAVESSETLSRVYVESIRLFSPGYVISRRAAVDLVCRARNSQDAVVFEQRIPAGEALMSTPTFAARDPSKFYNPDKFDPDRFEQLPKSLDWRPFGDGAHSCPGQTLAKYEVLVLAAYFIRNFTFVSFPEKEIGQKGLLTLKPVEEVTLMIIPRSEKAI